MKNKILKLPVLIVLLFVSSSLLAQKTSAAGTIEKQLTANNKKWKWYKDNPATDAAKDQTYVFHSNHKVDIITAGNTITDGWQIIQAGTVATAPVEDAGETAVKAIVKETIIKIGEQNYTLSFGADKGHKETIRIKSNNKKTNSAMDSYYYSYLISR